MPTCLASLDACFRTAAFPQRPLIEWISDDVGLNAASIALEAIAPMLTLPGCLAIVDERHEFHADAACCHWNTLSRLLLIRPERAASSTAGDQPQPICPPAFGDSQ